MVLCGTRKFGSRIGRGRGSKQEYGGCPSPGLMCFGSTTRMARHTAYIFFGCLYCIRTSETDAEMHGERHSQETNQTDGKQANSCDDAAGAELPRRVVVAFRASGKH